MGLFFSGKCRSKARLDGKTVIITGCNTGIGKYTALDLHARGARVIMACRNLKKAEEAAKWIKEKSEGNGEIDIKQLDLSSFASVRKCANEILQAEQNIHILINNAGVMMCPRELTEDGYELQFATNHLGHFLFTLLLLPRILKTANSSPTRIINVSSIGHHLGDLFLDDINLEKSYSPPRAYGRTKLANILFTKELARRLEGKNVTVYSLHPGIVDTELSRHLDYAIFPGIKWIYQKVIGFFLKSPQQGAQTTLHCALDEKAGTETGLYYDNCKTTTPSAKARNPELAKTLWDISVEMVKLQNYEPFQIR